MSQYALQIRSIEEKIFLVRGHKVMLDSHLAELYEVPTYRLNEQVKRNLKRFPSDFMFRLNQEETTFLTSQFAMSKPPHRTEWRGGRRTLPYVFTQEGVAMLSSVLNSDRAVQVNIHIMRAFVNPTSAVAPLRKIFLTEKSPIDGLHFPVRPISLKKTM